MECEIQLTIIASELLDLSIRLVAPVIRTYLSQQGARQTVNSGHDPAGNGLAERWVGITKVRATVLQY